MTASDLLAFGLVGGGTGMLTETIARRFDRLGGIVAGPLGWPAASGAAVGLAAAAVQPGPAGWTSAILGWWLLLLGIIDARHFLLPQALTVPLVGAGLAATLACDPEAIAAHAAGAVAGFVALASVAALYRRLRGRDGLGGGDAKLFAASGAWLGWASLPAVLALASAGGLIVAMIVWRGRPPATARLPFGVFLGAATWIVYLAR